MVSVVTSQGDTTVYNGHIEGSSEIDSSKICKEVIELSMVYQLLTDLGRQLNRVSQPQKRGAKHVSY